MLLLGFIASVLFFPMNAKADAWGSNAVAAVMKHTMEEITYQIRGILLGTLKQTAMETIVRDVDNMIAGVGMESAMFITDWNDFLVERPLRETELYMNDFFTLTTRGKAYGSNYRPSGGSSNYAGYLVSQARRATVESGLPQYDLDQYVSDPSNMFAGGNWRAFSSFISNPANNPIGYTLAAQSVQQEKLENRKKEAEAKGIAYAGYKPQEAGDGTVVTPGSTIKDIQSNTNDLGSKIIANAEHVPEIIAAVVTRTITNTIRNGIGNIERYAQREIMKKTNEAQRRINQTIMPQDIFRYSY